MKKYLLLIISLSFFIFSCEDNYEKDQTADYHLKDGEVVLKERDSNIPWIASNYKRQKGSTKSVIINHREYLGYSMKNDIYPFESTENLGYKVVDTKRLNADFSSYFNHWKVGGADPTYFSFSSFDRYNSTSTVTNKIEDGVNINLGIFSIGSKKKYTETFKETITKDENAVFGELNIIVRDSAHRMKISTTIKQDINEKYLTKEFKDDLYNLHPSEFFKLYGGFVVNQYITGGKATAVFAGLYKKQEKSITKERNMNAEINASFRDSVASGKLDIGRITNRVTSTTKEFSSVMSSVRTIGGISSIPSFSVAKEIKDISIDLSGWLNSLNDKSTHNLVEFMENGATPITEFISEFNLRKIIKGYIANGVNSIENLQEPYIKIELEYANGPIWVMCVNLYTRFGDKIILKQNYIYAGQADQYIAQEIKRYSTMFGVKMIKSTSKSTSPNSEIQGYTDTAIFKEELLKKCIHNGVIYIVSDYVPQGNQNDEDCYFCGKYAFSIYSNELLDQYAMRSLVNRLPTTNISIKTLLSQYRIMAL